MKRAIRSRSDFQNRDPLSIGSGHDRLVYFSRAPVLIKALHPVFHEGDCVFPVFKHAIDIYYVVCQKIIFSAHKGKKDTKKIEAVKDQGLVFGILVDRLSEV